MNKQPATERFTGNARQSERLTLPMQAFWTVCGAFLAVFAFFAVVAIFTGNPMTDLIRSAHGIFSDNGTVSLSEPEQKLVQKLTNQNLLLSTDGFLEQLNSFYTTLLAWTLSLFVVFGFVSFFIIRSGNRTAIEEFCEQQIEKQTANYWGHSEFLNQLQKISEKHIKEKWQDTGRSELDELWQRLEELSGSISEIRVRTASLDSAEEEGSDLVIEDGEEP